MEQELDGKTVILGHFSHTIMDLYWLMFTENVHTQTDT
jgi:hypothetical protein